MRTAVLERPGKIVVCEQPRPVPGDGELLVRVRAALTCGTDLKAYVRGHALIPMPGPFGHEFSGVVDAAGRGVRRFRRGDPVMAVHSAPCRTCVSCGQGRHNLCTDIMETKVLGAFSEYVLIPRHIVSQNVFRKPDHLDFREAAFLEPLACVVHGMTPCRIGPSTTVLVIGAGPIGLLHLLLARAQGARVLITGLEPERLSLARRLGAAAAFLPGETAGQVRAATDGAGADYVFECTGQPEVWEASVNHVRRGGTVVLFGGCRTGATVTFDAARLHYDEITLRGTFHFTPADVRKAYRLLSDRTVRVKRLISGSCGLDDLGAVFERLRSGEGVKFAVMPGR